MFPVSRARQAIFLFLATSALYFLTRSPALDEWDSVQFAMGVADFNLWRHQPHPPGYPLYIAFGWMGLHLLRLDVQTALQLGSAVGGGMFVACWFVLFSRRFAPAVAWVSTITLISLLALWMSATKTLTDPLGTGLLGLTLLCVDNLILSPRATYFLTASGGLAGAAAVGTRPQNFAAVLLIFVFAWLRDKSKPRAHALALVVFLCGCLVWLVPVLYLQSRTPESNGSWTAYAEQLVNQWRWRSARPKVFLGAEGQSGELLMERLNLHFAGWLRYGFGFVPETRGGWAGIALLALGWTFYGLERRRAEAALHKPFWQEHLPWAGVYVAVIFCCLPSDQRYYLPIFPLLILPAVAGWHGLPGRGRWTALLIPATTLAATLPQAAANHRQLPPPLRLIKSIQTQIPPAERPATWLILRDTRRHAEWYAPQFRIARAEELNAALWTQILQQPGAVFTDDPAIAALPSPDGRTWQWLKSFQRSPLIHRKHNAVNLYRLNPPPIPIRLPLNELRDNH